MNPNRINKIIAKFVSLPRYFVRRDIQNFLKIIGIYGLVVDLGSGLDAPYKDLFETDSYWAFDLYEPYHVRADIEKVPIKSNMCDIVVCTEVLEHIKYPMNVLREINRILKPGQYFLVTIPLLWGEHDYIDYQRWTETGLRTLLPSAGFEIIAFQKRGAIFSAIGCLISQIPQQVFGKLSTQKNLFVSFLYLLSIPFFLPIPWILSTLDFLDRHHQCVIGYSILARKL